MCGQNNCELGDFSVLRWRPSRTFKVMMQDVSGLVINLSGFKTYPQPPLVSRNMALLAWMGLHEPGTSFFSACRLRLAAWTPDSQMGIGS